MTDKQLNKSSNSLVIREMQILMALQFYLTPFTKAREKTQWTVPVGEDLEREEYSWLLVGLQTERTTLEINLEVPQKIGNRCS